MHPKYIIMKYSCFLKTQTHMNITYDQRNNKLYTYEI